ncbi:MAG: TetR/AcrR family transcriptional regulator [Lacrimispora sp.]|nr:TetR/AcrR family transcriptional regulator [Lacrimispora sp.]
MGSEERKQHEKEIKRQDIIDAAEKVFFANGYEKSSMDAVAQKAEFSKRTVYVYFNSKEQIYFEIMIRGYRQLLKMMKEGFEKEKPISAMGELHCIFYTLFSFREKYIDYFKAIMEYETKADGDQSGVTEDSKEECYRLGEEVLFLLIEALKKGKSDGSFKRDMDCEKTALILWAFTVGVFQAGGRKKEYLENYHHTTVEEFLEESFRLMIQLVVAKESGV